MERIKVLIATDDEIFQAGLCRFLEQEQDLECVGKPANVEDTFKLTRELQPDVAVIDIGMPLGVASADVGTAAEMARQIKRASPQTAMLMISAYGYQPGMLASLEAGVAGYLLKKTSPRELISAVRSLHAGKAMFDLEAINRLIGSLGANRGVTVGVARHLRPREIEVLTAVARGLSNKEIAAELYISERTVQTHLVHVFRKMGVNSRTEAVLRALREGWIRLEELSPLAR